MVLCKEGFRRILGHSRIPAGASGAVEGLAVADDALGGLFDSTHPAERIAGTASAVSPPSGRHAARFRDAINAVPRARPRSSCGLRLRVRPMLWKCFSYRCETAE